MLLGGSGSLKPGAEIILQCLLAGLAAAWVWTQSSTPSALHKLPREGWIIAALLLALPLCQLLPLPPALWHSLPGRAVEREALDLVGEASSWRPWSLTPNRTLASLLVMVASATMLVMAAAQDRRGRRLLLAIIAGAGLLSVLVGAAQLSGGGGNPFRFYNPDEAFLDGFQTNHNAEADVLLIAMVALAAAASEWGSQRPRPIAVRPLLGAIVGASLLLILGVILTASRTGIALLPIAIGAQTLILRRWLRLGRRNAVPAMAIAAALLVAVVALRFGHNTAMVRVLARFHATSEFRPEIWHDSVFALRQYWPWGGGMGSFIPVFAAAERLDVVTGRFVNRAHNDYLEFLIEAGLPGVLTLLGVGYAIASGAWRTARSRVPGSSAQMICGAANLAILGLHSLIDYPLRTMAIACIAAVSVGLLLPIPASAETGIAKEP